MVFIDSKRLFLERASLDDLSIQCFLEHWSWLESWRLRRLWSYIEVHLRRIGEIKILLASQDMSCYAFRPAHYFRSGKQMGVITSAHPFWYLYEVRNQPHALWVPVAEGLAAVRALFLRTTSGRCSIALFPRQSTMQKLVGLVHEAAHAVYDLGEDTSLQEREISVSSVELAILQSMRTDCGWWYRQALENEIAGVVSTIEWHRKAIDA